MALVRVKRFAQVTIPADIRRKARIEDGDFVEVSYDNKHIILTPKRVSDRTVDWVQKFDAVLGNVRKAAKQADLSPKHVDEAVKNARQRRGG